MEYAGVALRFVAVLIDGLVLVVPLLVLALVFGDRYSTTRTARIQSASRREAGGRFS